MTAKGSTARGLSRAVNDLCMEIKPGVEFSVETIVGRINGEFKGTSRLAVIQTLNYLKKQGVLEGGALRGTYCRRAGEATEADLTVVVIDNLLKAMAAAEPVLHRCKKFLAAMEAMK